MKLLPLLALLLFSSFSLAQVTQLTASVDRNTVLLDESISLSIVATGSASRDDLNFSELNKHFSVSRPAFSQSTQIVNGNMTRTVSWTVSLYPLDTGKFEIPSFAVGGQSSAPFNVTVLPLNAQNNNEPRDYYVEAKVSNARVYLQQQMLYTIKIYLSQDIQRGNLSLPELDGAIIEQIGEDKDYQEITDGVRYRIIERNYAIIPQSSGEFTINGPIFEAQVLTNSRQSFGNFGRTRTIARRAPNVDINVLPMPENYPYTWLPSEFVDIGEEWQGDANNLTEGEPLTRTITLTAMGLTKEQLPDIDSKFHPSFKVYPEQAQVSSVEHNNAIVAQGVYNTAIIPSQSGSFTLPEVKVPWFNVNTGQTEFATIAARSVDVKPRQVQSNSSAAAVPSETTPQEDVIASLDDENKRQHAGAPQWWLYVLIASNVFTLVLAMVLWFARQSPSTSKMASPKVNKSVLSEEQYYKHIKSQLEKGKSAHLSKQLDEWLSLLLGSEHKSVSLSLSRSKNSMAADSALTQYNCVLASQYSSSAVAIDYPALIKSLQQYRNHVLEQHSSMALSALYPK